MPGSNMIISLILQAVNKATSPLSAVNAQLRKLDDTAKATSKRFEHLNNIGSGLTRLGAGMTLAGGGLAYSLGLTDAVKQSLEVGNALRSMSNVGNLTEKQMLEIRRRIVETSRATNQYQRDLTEGMNTLVAAGLDPRIATDFMPIIGKTATATKAVVNDVANTSFSVYDNLKVPVYQLKQAMDTLNQAGKEGKFELKNMAQYFPMLTANAQALGMKGVPAVAQLGAALQIAMKGAGDPGQAANNMMNFMQKLTARETVQNFAKFGVNVKAEMNKALKSGADPIEHMMQVIMKVTGGDKFKLSKLFADMQVTNFIVPMMQNLKEYQRIRDQSQKSKGGIDKDFANMMKDPMEQMKQFKINLAAIAEPKVNQFFERLNNVLKTLNNNSTALKVVLGGIAVLIGGGALISGLGIAFTTISSGITAIKTITSALKAATVVTRLFNLTLLTNPIALVVAAVIAAAFLIYKYWGPISGFVKKIWAAIKTYWHAGIYLIRLKIYEFKKYFQDLWDNLLKKITSIDLFSAGKKILTTLVDGIKSVASAPFEALKAVTQKMRNLLPFSPAKEGPFRDLHKIKLVETIAASVKPGPLVEAMRNVAASAANTGLRPAAGFAGAAGLSGGGVMIQYSPTIHLSGASPAVKDDLMAVLRQHKDELLRIVEQAKAKKERVRF